MSTQANFGNVFDDALEIVTHPADDFSAAVDALGSALKGLPGGDLVLAAVAQGADWATSLANNATGNMVLRALATVLYGPLATSLGIGWFGPQLASVVWALPGVVRGQDFITAWTTEFAWRAGETAKVLGGDAAKQAFDQVGPALQQMVDEASAHYGVDISVNPFVDTLTQKVVGEITPEELAAKLGIRVDVAALAIEYLKGQSGLYDMSKYDPATGAPMDTPLFGPPTPPPTPPVIHQLVSRPTNSAANPGAGTLVDLKAKLALAQKNGSPPAVITALQNQITAMTKKAAAMVAVTPKITGVSRAKIEAQIKTSSPTGTYNKNAPTAPSAPPKPLPATAQVLTPESGVGAAGGAAIGFAVAGPVGAAAGAVAGFVAGYFAHGKL